MQARRPKAPEFSLNMEAVLRLKTALFYSRVYGRVIRPGLSILHQPPDPNCKLSRAFQQMKRELDALIRLQPAA